MDEALYQDIQKKILLGKPVKHSVNKGQPGKQHGLPNKLKPAIVYDEYTKSYKI